MISRKVGILHGVVKTRGQVVCSGSSTHVELRQSGDPSYET